jgi:hypothetical protein
MYTFKTFNQEYGKKDWRETGKEMDKIMASISTPVGTENSKKRKNQDELSDEELDTLLLKIAKAEKNTCISFSIPFQKYHCCTKCDRKFQVAQGKSLCLDCDRNLL